MPGLQWVLGARIQQARQKLGLTQRQLAEQAGLPAHQIVSQIEKGKREVKAWELVRIAQVLYTDVNALLTAGLAPTPTVLWRDDPGKGAPTREARFLQRCREYHMLERLLELPPPPPLPRFEVAPSQLTPQAADRLAVETQRTLGLGSRPAASLVRVLEAEYRVKIWYEPMDTVGSAACVVGSIGYAVLVNAGHAPWRRNYSLAHELFHLVTWHSVLPELRSADPERWSRVERAAQVFASTLLLPADAVCAEFDARVESGAVKYVDLVELARDFDVSTEALLWRLAHLGRIEESEAQRVLGDLQFKDLDRGTMAERWCEPLVPPERFVRLAFLAYQKGKLSRSRLAKLLGTSLIDLGQVLGEYGLQEAEDYQAAAAVA